MATGEKKMKYKVIVEFEVEAKTPVLAQYQILSTIDYQHEHLITNVITTPIKKEHTQ